MELLIKAQLYLVSRWCFPESTGGVAMHNYYLCQALNTCLDFRLLSIDSPTNISSYKNTNTKYYGISVQSFINYNLPILKNALRSFSDYKISKLYSEKLNKESGLIEFMDIHSEGYRFLMENPEKRKNVVIRSHTPFGLLKQFFNKSELKGSEAWFAFEREKKCFNWAGSITTPSNDLKKRICAIYEISSKKVTVIPNILDTNHFSPQKVDKNQIFTILLVGRFERAKGVETLIKAFIKLSKKYSNIQLYNIGSPRGNSLKKCMALLKKNNLTDKVFFTGFVEYDELPSYYAKADIVVVPSEIYESFSYTVAQGMSCGKPVIASKIGGIPETLNHGEAGILFESGNVDNLYEELISLINDKLKRKILGEKARLFAVNNFSMTVLKPIYLEFYKSLRK